MAEPTSPKNINPFYIFPSSPKIKSKISTNIKTLIHPLDLIPTIAELALTLLPKAKASLLHIIKEAKARLQLPPSTVVMLLSFLESIDIKAFVNGFVIPCLKKLMKIVRGRLRPRPRRRSYAVARRLRLSFSRKFRSRINKSASSSYFRFHYNWSSRSYKWPVPANVLAGCHSDSYRVLSIKRLGNGSSSGSTDASEEAGYGGDSHYSQLIGYLEWLEQREHDQYPSSGDSSSRMTVGDIDTLAEKFIEEKYEMFILEKQESERRFQEMMARSL
ncbi:hypothetical protein MLD38_019521 [Melastoma candidum]|uniref:Uncharacterized protein n=1 Tax=Melastoma candidum TaxID=119954 RepID=A0ACB9QXB8_9MYRT|nr:hypothetical protein MLD38_019521 [Melastoma candidum]